MRSTLVSVENKIWSLCVSVRPPFFYSCWPWAWCSPCRQRSFSLASRTRDLHGNSPCNMPPLAITSLWCVISFLPRTGPPSSCCGLSGIVSKVVPNNQLLARNSSCHFGSKCGIEYYNGAGCNIPTLKQCRNEIKLFGVTAWQQHCHCKGLWNRRSVI